MKTRTLMHFESNFISAGLFIVESIFETKVLLRLTAESIKFVGLRVLKARHRDLHIT